MLLKTHKTPEALALFPFILQGKKIEAQNWPIITKLMSVLPAFEPSWRGFKACAFNIVTSQPQVAP